MGTISARVPDDLEAAFEEFVEEENLDRSTALRKLLTEGLGEWREQRALEKLESGDVAFTRAAELADCSVWEFARLAKDHDVTWVGREGVESDLDSL